MQRCLSRQPTDPERQDAPRGSETSTRNCRRPAPGDAGSHAKNSLPAISNLARFHDIHQSWKNKATIHPGLLSGLSRAETNPMPLVFSNAGAPTPTNSRRKPMGSAGARSGRARGSLPPVCCMPSNQMAITIFAESTRAPPAYRPPPLYRHRSHALPPRGRPGMPSSRSAFSSPLLRSTPGRYRPHRLP